MKAFKILFISSWYPNKLEPTNGIFVQRHAQAVAQKHHVQVLHAVGNPQQKACYLFEETQLGNIKQLLVYYKATKFPLINFFRRFLAYFKGFKKIERPDLVHANVLLNNLIFVCYLKLIFGIKYVVSEHFTDFRSVNHNNLSGFKKKTAKFIGNHASCLFPVTYELKAGLQHLGIKTQMIVIPNVVAMEQFFPKECSEDKKFHFLHISNLSDRKNPKSILHASIELLSLGLDFELHLGGNGSEEILKKLETWVQRSGFQQQIHIFGALDVDDVARKMRSADCFILFSSDENQPCVINEAFASGVKVISTNVGGISEFFPKEFGYLIGENMEELKKAMKKVCEEKNTYSRAPISAFAKAHFSQEHIRDRFHEVYQDLLK